MADSRDSLVRRLAEVDETLGQAVKADDNEEDENALNYYEKAFDQLERYREEFDKQYKCHYDRAEAIAGILSSGSSKTATAQLRRFRTGWSPKSSHFVKISNVKLDDVGGLEDCKQVLKEAATWPVKYPHFFTGNRKPWRSVLLFGPPGSGKTLLAKAIAAEANYNFSRISPSDIVSMWMGQSERQVSDLFQKARKEAPSIIFIDEIDSLCGERGKNDENEPSRRIKSELLIHMQDVCDGEDDVLILAATNTPDVLDQAIRRRFDMRIYVPLPNPEARKFIFKVHIGETPHSIGEEDLQQLATDTEGFSGSDISSYVKDALYSPIRATLREKFFVKTKDKEWVPCHDAGVSDQKSLLEIEELDEISQIQVPKIKYDDFKKVCHRHKPTVVDDVIKLLEEFKNEFGVSGE